MRNGQGNKMKAILDYNGFTKMVEIPNFMPDIHIPVIPELSVTQMILDSTPAQKGVKRWLFVFKEWLYKREIALYWFDKEE